LGNTLTVKTLQKKYMALPYLVCQTYN